MTGERDELAHTVQNVTGVMRKEAALRYADALLEAGYRKPSIAKTLAELKALPIGTVALTERGQAWQKVFFGLGPTWMTYGQRMDDKEAAKQLVPLTVIHTSKESRPRRVNATNWPPSFGSTTVRNSR